MAGADVVEGFLAHGGDPSVVVLEGAIYVAYQGTRGGVYVIRLARRSGAYTASDRWEPVVGRRAPKGSAHALGRPEPGSLDPDRIGFIGDGWLPNLSGRTLETGEDRLAVVWENNEGEAIDKNGTKHVSLEYLHHDPEAPEPFFASGGHDLVWSPAATEDGNQYQLSPAVAVSPENTPLGLTVEVIWAQMDEVRNSATLLHATFRFDAECVTA